jgi:DNA-binding response OmpR family regulator
MSRDRAILLVHDDPGYLDRLTRVFEARGFVVSVAATRMAALGRIEARTAADDFDVVVAGWDRPGALGQSLYRWALGKRYHLRGRFVFLAQDAPDGFDELVQGRCVWVSPSFEDEMVRAVEAAARRVEQIRGLDDGDLEWFDDDTPRLLIADDEPLHLAFMSRLFRDVGFAVAMADSGNAAIGLLSGEERFDVLLVDWFMSDGSGADLYEWLCDHRPELVERCIFLSGLIGSNLDFIRRQVPECNVFPKGQDSLALVRTVVSTAKLARAGDS